LHGAILHRGIALSLARPSIAAYTQLRRIERKCTGGSTASVLNGERLIARIHAEERLLSSLFGAEYDAYRARTSRLIPGIY